MDEQRAEFEAWAKTHNLYPLWRDKGRYVYWESEWGAWQAATQRQQERIAELEAALHLARGEVAYMASGMTHANWKTMEAQKTLDVIDAAIARATHKEGA